MNRAHDPYPPERCREGGSTLHLAHGTNRFRHEALFYAGDDEFLGGTVPFIVDALNGDEPVLVAVGDARIRLLKDALGEDAERVRFRDMRQLGANPARIIPAWHEFLRDEAGGGGRALGVGEPIWPGRSEAELSECRLHEWLLNLAFDEGQAWTLLCPYDLDGLDEATIDAARLNHRFLAHRGESRGSDAYLDPQGVPGVLDGSLPAPASPPEVLPFTGEGLASLRDLVFRRAAEARLDEPRREDLVLAVNELATNSVQYGGGSGTLQIWKEDEVLVCEVRDSGRIDEPLVGRTPPTPGQVRGRGVWLVNHLCDLVQVRTTPGGNVVRIRMRPV